MTENTTVAFPETLTLRTVPQSCSQPGPSRPEHSAAAARGRFLPPTSGHGQVPLPLSLPEPPLPRPRALPTSSEPARLAVRGPARGGGSGAVPGPLPGRPGSQPAGPWLPGPEQWAPCCQGPPSALPCPLQGSLCPVPLESAHVGVPLSARTHPRSFCRALSCSCATRSGPRHRDPFGPSHTSLLIAALRMLIWNRRNRRGVRACGPHAAAGLRGDTAAGQTTRTTQVPVQLQYDCDRQSNLRDGDRGHVKTTKTVSDFVAGTPHPS